MPDLTPSEAIAKIRERYGDIDRLKVLAASQYEPDAGSELATDDLDWPYLRVSETARYGLAAAVDHLDCYRFVVEQRRLFPSGQLTLVRAAIVGAAQAVWVLAPDDRDVRIERGGELQPSSGTANICCTPRRCRRSLRPMRRRPQIW